MLRISFTLVCSTDSLEDGYVGSGKHLWRSIRKHGKENHSTEIIEHLPSRERLVLREEQLVNEELLGDVLCMNIRLGGLGGFDHLQHYSKEDISTWRRKGACASAKTRSDMHTNRLKTDSAYEAKWRGSLSVGGRRRAATEGYVNPNSGNTYSAEVKQKMSDSNTGERNSQYGTCWVYSLEEQRNMKISKDEIISYEKLGWVKGRKMFQHSV